MRRNYYLEDIFRDNLDWLIKEWVIKKNYKIYIFKDETKPGGLDYSIKMTSKPAFIIKAKK